MAKAQAQEPSMEEILASIRRIIADQDKAAAPRRASARPAPVPPETTAFPDLTAVAAPGTAPGGDPSEEELDRLFAAAEAEPSNEAEAVVELSEDMAEPDFAADDLAPPESPSAAPSGLAQANGHAGDGVVSPAPAAEPVLSARPRPESPHGVTAPQAAPGRAASDRPLLSPTADATVTHAFNRLAGTILSQNARTLEDLVSDMLRPMLKEWLDENLPSLVERLVRLEIERVARGSRY